MSGVLIATEFCAVAYAMAAGASAPDISRTDKLPKIMRFISKL